MSPGEAVEHRGFTIRMRAPFEYEIEGIRRPPGAPVYYWTLRGAKMAVGQMLRRDAVEALLDLRLPDECVRIHGWLCVRYNLGHRAGGAIRCVWA